MNRPVYLDYAATTPVDPQVAARMAECLTIDGTFGNPASRSHVYGWEAEERVEEARAQLAALVNCDVRELVWTSGATEADNLAIKGIAERRAARGERPGHIVTSAIEHKAVLDSCHALEARGFDVTYLAPNAAGETAPELVAAALRRDTVLVSVMHANNEIGSVNDIAAIGALTRSAGVAFHVDAAQSLGKLPIDLAALPIDLMSFSAHKLYGPKGIGALFVRRRPGLELAAQIHGGGQERGMRSGTLPTHQIVGFGAAAALAQAALASEPARLLALRERLWRGLAQIDGVRLNSAARERLPGLLNVGFAGVDGEVLMSALVEVAVSNGSACTSLLVEPSYVLRALGVPEPIAHASIRLTVGRFTSEADIDSSVRHLREVLDRLRGFDAKSA